MCRIVRQFVPILRAGWHTYTSEGLNRGVGPFVADVAECPAALTQGRARQRADKGNPERPIKGKQDKSRRHK